MEYPKIINKDNKLIAYLNNLTECKIKEVVNGEYTLSFIATVDDLKTQFLYDEDNVIEVNNDLFKPLIIEELHTDNNELTVLVKCEHISYDLLDKHFNNFSYSNRTATEMMVNCLQDTDFVFTGTDVTMKTNINYQQECNAKQISIAIANNWRGELQYHRYNIHLWLKRGKERGVDFRFGKNIKAIKKTTDRSKRDENGNPALSYEIDIVELKHIDGFEDLEYFELGDTVRIVDDMLSINTKMRIVERVYNVLTETNESVVLGNVLDDIRGSLSGIGEAKKQAQEAVDILDDNMPNWDRIKAITNDLGNVITQKLDGEIKTSQNKIVNSTGTVSFIDNGILIHNQPTEEQSTWAMKLTAGGLAIADAKNPDGTWKWTTMATGAGIVAEAITAGVLSAITIDGVEITGTDITGGTINGVTINGATIYIGDKASGNYISLAPGSPFEVYYNNEEQIEMWTDERMGGYILANRPDGKTAFRVQGLGNSVNGFQMHAGDLNGSLAEFWATSFRFIGTGSYPDFYAKADGYFNGDLGCRGEKTAIVATEHYGERKLYAEESDRLYFSTKGVAQTVNNKHIIRLDDVFFETIEPNSVYPYAIKLTPYADTRVFVKDVFDKYIIIGSHIDCKFSYDIACIRKGYKDTYLEEKDLRANMMRNREV